MSGAVNRVVVSDDSGNVVVQSGGPASVASHQQWNLLAPSLSQSLSGGVLTVRATCPNVPANGCSVDLTITVPAQVSVAAEAAAGDVTTRNLVGDESLRSSAGDVRAALTSTPTFAQLTSAAGNVFARVPAGVYDVQASSDAGAVTVTGITRQAGAPHRLVGRSSAGDVTLAGR